VACATWEKPLTEAAAPAADAPEPKHGFDDSRRLTGPNRYFAGTAVTLTPLGRTANDAASHARWAQRVRDAALRLGWPDPQPCVQRHAHGTLLVFAAPEDTLLSATELGEWAWEHCLDDAGEHGFDRAQPLGSDPVAVLAARAQAERRPALNALRAQARARGLPFLEDDDEVSIGAGCGSRTWPRDALPAPEAVAWPALHDVPTVLVTGSNGKTTTVRVLAAIARSAGLAVGLCSTEGVLVDGQTVAAGDYSGPAGARTVLRDGRVQAAVLETARGGLLRRGLAVRRADAAVVTNLSADHFGEYGIDTVDDLAAVKLVVAHALPPGAMLVLNGADEVLMRAAAWLPHARAARQGLFATDGDHPRLAAHCAEGGSTCGARAGQLVLHHAGGEHDLGEIAALPLTLGGTARHNIDNLAAAALAAAAAGWPVDAIRSALADFGARPQDNPGRLERRAYRGATVLIDYAHNPDGLTQLLTVARALAPRRLGLLLGQAGNRDDAALGELAHVAARFAPDLVLLKELPDMLRGRAPGETSAVLRRELLAAGVPAPCVRDEPDEESAALALLAWAQPGDLIVLPVHRRAVRERLALRLQG
jgi:UDP-N-acetylmuramyl tripeptide synthase